MGKKPELNSWSAKQALAILAVDNTQVSDFAHELIKHVEDKLITHDQAKEVILRRAKTMVSDTVK